MAKKWYSYFVVTDDAQNPEDSSGESGRSAEATTAQALAAEVPAMPVPEVSAPSVDLSVVYQSAKIEAPAHGYTVLKVADMLRSEHLQALPADVKKKSILVALDAAGVSVDDIVRDAVRRDKALDTYERVLEQHVAGVKSRVLAENQQIEAEIARRVAELRGRIDENNKTAAADEAEFAAWRTRKREEERLIADAVSYFVSENPITTAPPASAPAKGDPDVR